MTIDSNRLLLELEKQRREVNRNIINPAIPQLSLDALTPMLNMVAQARKDYLCGLLEIAGKAGGCAPSDEQVERLRLREPLRGKEPKAHTHSPNPMRTHRIAL